MSDNSIEVVRKIALALPEVAERLSHGAPTFYFRRRPICYFHDAEFSSDERTSIWCPAPEGAQAQLVATDPRRYFAPTPSASGVFGHWIGAYVDPEGDPDWDEIAQLIEDAFCCVAPKKLIAQLGN